MGQGSLLRTYYMNRNRLLYIRRNSRGLRRWSGVLFFLLVAVPKQSLLFILKRKQAHLRELWRGLAWHLGPHNVHQNHFL